MNALAKPMVEGFRKRGGQFATSTGVMGGNKCQFCQRRIRMGAVDAHKCYRVIISISIDRSQLKRIDALADASGMNRSEFLAACALASSNVSRGVLDEARRTVRDAKHSPGRKPR